MKNLFLKILLITGFVINIYAQDITVVPHDTLLTDTLGSDIAFYLNVTNISATEQTVFLVRTINNIPSSWQSSLCFEYCFAPSMDSIATVADPPFNSTPLQPNETREMSLHVFALSDPGVGTLQIQAGTFRNQNNRITVNLTAIANYTDVNETSNNVNEYYLNQNYPNPFNPNTKINFGLKKAGNVTISLYNVLGSKAATIFDGYKDAGNHSVNFDGSQLSSGVYFYKITSSDFTQTKKMVLEK